MSPRPTVALLVGPSGAGKTTVGRALAERLGWAFEDADAYHSEDAIATMARGEGLTDADRAPWLARLAALVDARLADGPPTVLACSALRAAYRERLVRPGVALVWLDVPREALARRLAARRGHFAGPDLLDSQLAAFEPPTDALRVDATRPVSDLVATIAAGLATPQTFPTRRIVAMPDPLLAAVRTIPDFPTPGVGFKDLTPLLADPALARDTVERLAAPFLTAGVTHVVGLDARGFWFGPSLALRLGAGFVPIRKAGKLPPPVTRADYALEYGTDAVELAHGALGPGARLLLHDDVLATGGTAAAALDLVRGDGVEVLALTVVLELAALGGRDRLPGVRVEAALTV